MENVLLTERLIDACLKQGWISTSAAERVSSLCRNGLHPEQALLGTKLVDEDRYGEALSQAHGLPFMRVLPEMADRLRETLPEALQQEARAVPLALDGKDLFVGFVDPSHATLRRSVERAGLEQGIRVKPFVILVSDWRIHRPSAAWSHLSSDRLERSIFSVADAGGLHELWLVPHGQTVQVHFHHGPAVQPSFTFPAAFLSALRLRFQRRSLRSSWVVDSGQDRFSQGLHLVRDEGREDAPHPIEWAAGWQDFLDEERGMLVLMQPDGYVRQKISQDFDECTQADQMSRRPGSYWVDARQEEGQELALHAALLGHKTVAVSKAGDPWWRSAVEAGIPVRVLQASRLPRGTAWSLYPEQV